MYKKLTRFFTVVLAALLFAGNGYSQTQSIGIFDGHSDVGPVKNKGDVKYDAKNKQYTVSGAGTNIWANTDEFHYVWKKMKGDFILRTNAEFIGKGTELHRKWGWMVRKSLDGNSAHVNAVVHGDGLTSLQYRKTTGAVTEEQKSATTFAGLVQLKRKGNIYTMSVAKAGEAFGPEEKVDIDLGDDVYVGLFVCSHNPDVVEQAVFSKVSIKKLKGAK
jgi:TolB protein